MLQSNLKFKQRLTETGNSKSFSIIQSSVVKTTWKLALDRFFIVPMKISSDSYLLHLTRKKKTKKEKQTSGLFVLYTFYLPANPNKQKKISFIDDRKNVNILFKKKNSMLSLEWNKHLISFIFFFPLDR